MNVPEGVADEVQEAYRKALRYRRRDYVTGIGIGEPLRGGELMENGLAICIQVREKFPKSHLTKRQLFPSEIDGIPVDVCERRFAPRCLTAGELIKRQYEPAYPAVPGVQIGVEGVPAGTLGMLVYDMVDGAPCLLSSAHVLNGAPPTDVYQPGARNGMNPIGTLVRSMFSWKGDAAIARLDRMRPADSVPLGLTTPIAAVRCAYMNEVLVKSGAETGVTRGQVSVFGQCEVDYGSDQFWMSGFVIRPLDLDDVAEISDEGDSGSVWYNEQTGEAVGMTTAGDPGGRFNANEWVFCCRLDVVFGELLISLDPEARIPM